MQIDPGKSAARVALAVAAELAACGGITCQQQRALAGGAAVGALTSPGRR